jgi:hypothetical protein
VKTTLFKQKNYQTIKICQNEKIILLLAISFAITSTHAQFWKKKDAAQTDSTKKEESNEGEKKKKVVLWVK